MDSNKAHCHDCVLARMLKLRCPYIIKLLFIIFCNCLKFETFPDDWKKDSVVPVHKKDNKRICSKVFEKLIFDAIFEFMIENNLLQKQPTEVFYKKNVFLKIFQNSPENTCTRVFFLDSCVNQLISITHSIFCALDANPSLEVCDVFLDLSRAFD